MRYVLAATAAALAALAAWIGIAPDDAPAPAPAVARSAAPLPLFTSLPLYWGGAVDVGAMIGGQSPRHWARSAIEARRSLMLFDTLDDPRLGPARDLLVVQPRPLSPGENVALDDWVGGGGRLLLFADPALTSDSPFAIGDKRRPQDTVLLSPILRRWGLELAFDDEQPFGERTVAAPGGVALPVNLPGRLVAVRGGRDDARCTISAQAVVAECTIGAGRATIVADAALFEDGADRMAMVARETALEKLLDRAFAE